MTAFSFNAADVAPQESFSPLPAGVYLAHAVESAVAPTRTGGQMIKMTFQVLQGQYANRKVFANINVRNSNPDAERIGQSQLSALCHATGVLQLQDTSQLHNKPVNIRVRIRKDDTGQYGDKNEVSGFEAASAAGVPASAAPAARFPAAPPAANQPAQPASPPWAKRA